jgi:hypothetical protein
VRALVGEERLGSVVTEPVMEEPTYETCSIHEPPEVWDYRALCRLLMTETNPDWRKIYEAMRPVLEMRYRYTQRKRRERQENA